MARRTITPLAESQRGLVTTRQAAGLGVPRLAISRLEDAGDLERITHGVYRMAGADEDERTDLYAHWLALDSARTAQERLADLDRLIAVSHRSAAASYGIGTLLADAHTYTSSYRKQSQRAGVRVHTGRLTRDDVRIEHGMLVTTPERTIADLAHDEPDQSYVADALGDAIESLMTSRNAVIHSIGAKATDSLLSYRGLDQATLAAKLASAAISTPALAAIEAAIQQAIQRAIGPSIEGTLRPVLDSIAGGRRPALDPAVTEAIRVSSAQMLEIRTILEPLAKAALPMVLRDVPWSTLHQVSTASAAWDVGDDE